MSSSGAERAPDDRSRMERALDGIASSSSRRGFLSRLGKGMAAVTAGGAVAKMVQPARLTASTSAATSTRPIPALTRSARRCRGSTAPVIRLSRKHGKPVDNLGRRVNGAGEPVDDRGEPLRDPDGRPLPPAPRTKVCQEGVKRIYDINTHVDGGWYRCCGGQVRKLVDCCSQSNKRINGDASLKGYCYQGRKVFCVMYFDTNVPC